MIVQSGIYGESDPYIWKILVNSDNLLTALLRLAIEVAKEGENKMKKAKCICGNPKYGFDCICNWIKNHPGDREFTCEFCGIYSADSPRCNERQEQNNKKEYVSDGILLEILDMEAEREK